ncbi:hypothetical protein B0H10DRAFT_1956653 [Mycena sp. CBHHK59/15]|nr:hypothetical protein B0H10DRAFT_1956653 [Mycena sp. CBHHK59/15]
MVARSVIEPGGFEDAARASCGAQPAERVESPAVAKFGTKQGIGIRVESARLSTASVGAIDTGHMEKAVSNGALDLGELSVHTGSQQNGPAIEPRGPNGNLLASLVVLAENDEWAGWTALAEWLDYADIHTWTIAVCTKACQRHNLAWVIIA